MRRESDPEMMLGLAIAIFFAVVVFLVGFTLGALIL